MKRAYEHHDELLRARTLIIETDGQVVRVACDSPGIAAVSHVLTVEEWDVLVASVREAQA